MLAHFFMIWDEVNGPLLFFLFGWGIFYFILIFFWGGGCFALFCFVFCLFCLLLLYFDPVCENRLC